MDRTATPFGFTVDTAERRLLLAHPSIEVAWSWDEHGRIVAARLLDTRNRTEWIDPQFPSQFYRSPVGPDGFTPPSLSIGPVHSEVGPISIETDPDGRTRAGYQMRPAGGSLALTWKIEAFPDHAAIRQWVEITNEGTETVLVPRLPVFHWVFGDHTRDLTAHHGLERRNYLQRPEWPDWFTWSSEELQVGQLGRIVSGYRSEATWLALTTRDGGPGLVFGWESNAEAVCEYGDLNGNGSLVIDCALFPEYRLAPGQTLTGPAGFVVLASGDLDEVAYRGHRFVDDVLAWKAADPRFPHVAFNSWGYREAIDERSMQFCLDLCMRLGVEHFVVDFGWEDPDWNPLPERFPNGLAPFADAAHTAGMLFGIHLSYGNISSLSRAFREHPDWGNGPGQWAYREAGDVYGLTLGNPATRDWLIDTLVRVADETKIDHFVTDHYLWGPLDPARHELHATNDYQTIAEGFDDVLARFHALRPNVMIEHCDNGIGLPTFKMVQQHVTAIGVDALSSLDERIFTWRGSYVLPPRFLDNYVCDMTAGYTFIGEGLTDYDYRSHMHGGPLILMTAIKTLEEGSDEWKALERAIGLYKRIRGRLLNGKVLHLLEPKPLAQVGRTWDGWDAIGSYDEAADSAIVFAFRLGGDLDRRTIPLHGLRAGTRYRVTFEDDTRSFEAHGAELMASGIELTLPGAGQPRVVDGNNMIRGSEVVYLEPVAD